MLDALNLYALGSNNHPLNKRVGRSIEESNLVLVQRNRNAELEICTIGIKETVATQQKLNHVSWLGPVDCCCGLVPAELDLVLDCLRLDICIVQAIGNNSVRGGHVTL